jgi:hypothetical protein
MSLTPEVALDDLFELLKDQDHWTQGSLARRADGFPIHPLHPQAARWCLIGGIQEVTDFKSASFNAVILLLSTQVFGTRFPQMATNIFLTDFDNYYRYLEDFNDRSTHPQVMDLIDATRKSLRNGD